MREQRHAVLPGARHPQLHRLVADHLAVAALALDHQDGAALADQLGVTVGHELSGADVFDVDRQQADAVGIVAGEIGLDQMVGDQSRLTLGAAARGADAHGSARAACRSRRSASGNPRRYGQRP